MSVYKDLEKRKLYQKIWAREKVLKKRAIEIVPESVVESVGEIIIPRAVESINAEVDFCLQFYRMRDLRKKHNLTDFAYWMMKNRRVNIEFHKTYKNNFIPVETEETVKTILETQIVETQIVETQIVEIIVASHFNCEECKFKIKRTEYNKYHTKCIDCFYPNRIRGKCLIILDQ
jgi:hypothetical protein